MFMWYLAWKEVNTSTQESQVTLFNLGFFLLLAGLFLFVLSYGCVACEVGIALGLVCLVREGEACLSGMFSSELLWLLPTWSQPSG